jgi:small subunit ribosomal protein S16
VADARTKRDGDYLEKLGQYDPVVKDNDKKLAVNAERIKYWVGQGAQFTEGAAVLLRKAKVLDAAGKVVVPTAPPAAPATK